jgi:phytoene dehydrogenase-like protein
MAEGMVEAFLNEPSPLNLMRSFSATTPNPAERWETVTDLLRGYGQVLRGSFEGEEVPALIGWMAAQSGPPPGEMLSAPFALWHPMYHVSGVKRPRGGSGMLTQALASMIQARGGSIMTNAPVKRILVEKGRAIGAETEDGATVSARVIVSGAHIYTTAQMLGDDLPPTARNLIQRSRIGNGFGMIARYAVDELPNYTAAPTQNPAGDPHHVAMQFICPSLDYLQHAYADYLRGESSRDPALIVMTWSAADTSLAPEGKHVMFVWSQYHPYELASGQSWDDLAEKESDRLLTKLAEYAPNVKSAVSGQLIETPLYIERTLGLLRGNVMHLEMSVDQMFMLRPALTMSQYRGPVKGLYLTGASTHPGGGIMGAAGRNAARAALHDLSRPTWRLGGHV